jgi:hypothetical protein
LMHFVLLGFLPIQRMRQSTEAGYAAGCGQFFLADRQAYFDAMGHSAIYASRHDGIKLPRAFREVGFATDIFDATDIARCRMYESTAQVCNGLLKNATEGIANPRLIVPFTVLLVCGSILPLPLAILGLWFQWPVISVFVLFVAATLQINMRHVCAQRYRQSRLGAWLHPIGVAWFVVLQWIAFVRGLLGFRTLWRGRN